MHDRRITFILALILLAYLAAGASYALLTPAWQVPDEPAHFNYVRHLAEAGTFPVLSMGDYPHAYLEEIKSRRFPPDMSIDPIRYESHQPPLYYLLAVPIYLLFSHAPLLTRLIALRLFSVLIGGALLLVAFRLVRENFPDRPALALGTTAFIAFLPMHVAMTAGVNNDALAEVVLALNLLLLLRYMRRREAGPVPTSFRLWLGAALGLALLTKTTVYIVIPLALAAIGWAEWRAAPAAQRLRRILLALLPVFGLGVLMALPWYLRNSLTYGGWDILGLRRHDAVVVGQPRTSEWLALFGVGGMLRQFVRTTFQSFWGQFGWMGVLLDSRLYMALALLSGLVAAGDVRLVWRLARRELSLRAGEKRAVVLLALSGVLTALGLLWYNLTFVQHQGRYLFPALIPIGLAFSAGLWELAGRRGARTAALLCGVGALGFLLCGIVRGDVPAAWAGLLVLAAAIFGVQAWRGGSRSRALLFSLFFLGLWALDFLCLFNFILPALAG